MSHHVIPCDWMSVDTQIDCDPGATWHIVKPDEKKVEDEGGVEEKPAPPMPEGVDMDFLAELGKRRDEALKQALGQDGAAGMYSKFSFSGSISLSITIMQTQD